MSVTPTPTNTFTPTVSPTASITPTVIPPSAPDSIIDLIAIPNGVGSDSVTLHWSEPYNGGSSIYSYEVRYSIDGHQFDIDGEASGGQTTYTVYGLPVGIIIYFKIITYNSLGTSQSNTAETTVGQPTVCNDGLYPSNWYCCENGGASADPQYCIAIDQGYDPSSFPLYYIPAPSPTPTKTSNIPAASPSPTSSVTGTPTYTPTRTPTSTPTHTPAAPAATPTPTKTSGLLVPTPTQTPTKTGTSTPTPTNTPTFTPTSTIKGVPGPSTNLTAISTNRAVALEWTPPSNERSQITGYDIEISNNASNWIHNAETDGNTANYIVSDLTNGVMYFFRVLAKNSFGVGIPSNIVEAVPLPPNVTPSVSPTSSTTPIINNNPIEIRPVPSGAISSVVDPENLNCDDLKDLLSSTTQSVRNKYDALEIISKEVNRLQLSCEQSETNCEEYQKIKTEFNIKLLDFTESHKNYVNISRVYNSKLHLCEPLSESLSIQSDCPGGVEPTTALCCFITNVSGDPSGAIAEIDSCIGTMNQTKQTIDQQIQDKEKDMAIVDGFIGSFTPRLPGSRGQPPGLGSAGPKYSCLGFDEKGIPKLVPCSNRIAVCNSLSDNNWKNILLGLKNKPTNCGPGANWTPIQDPPNMNCSPQNASRSILAMVNWLEQLNKALAKFKANLQKDIDQLKAYKKELDGAIAKGAQLKNQLIGPAWEALVNERKDKVKQLIDGFTEKTPISATINFAVPDGTCQSLTGTITVEGEEVANFVNIKYDPGVCDTNGFYTATVNMEAVMAYMEGKGTYLKSCGALKTYCDPVIPPDWPKDKPPPPPPRKKNAWGLPLSVSVNIKMEIDSAAQAELDKLNATLVGQKFDQCKLSCEVAGGPPCCQVPPLVPAVAIIASMPTNGATCGVGACKGAKE